MRCLILLVCVGKMKRKIITHRYLTMYAHFCIIKATIKEHGAREGIPQTIIQRPTEIREKAVA